MDIIIASDPERENLFAEIHANGQPWAEVIYSVEVRKYVVTLFPPTRGEEWPQFELEDLLLALAHAKKALIERGYPAE